MRVSCSRREELRTSSVICVLLLVGSKLEVGTLDDEEETRGTVEGFVEDIEIVGTAVE